MKNIETVDAITLWPYSKELEICLPNKTTVAKRIDFRYEKRFFFFFLNFGSNSLLLISPPAAIRFGRPATTTRCYNALWNKTDRKQLTVTGYRRAFPAARKRVYDVPKSFLTNGTGRNRLTIVAVRRWQTNRAVRGRFRGSGRGVSSPFIGYHCYRIQRVFREKQTDSVVSGPCGPSNSLHSITRVSFDC